MSFCFLKSCHNKIVEVDEVSDLSFLIKVPKPPYIPIQNNHEYFVDQHQHPTPHQCDEQLYRFARSWPPSMTMPDLPCHMRTLVLCVGLFSGLSPLMELGIKQPRSCPLPTDVLHIISQKPTTIYDYIRLWCVCRSWRSLQHTRSIGNLELTKWVFGKFWLNFRQDSLVGMRRRWLKYVLLSLAMNIVYSQVQFCFRMNEIFKSKVGLK